MKQDDRRAKCTRCRHVHLESERVLRPRRSTQMYESSCPRCACKSYYDMTPQVAWCWASGVIELGDKEPADQVDGSGPIVIARGPKYALRSQLEVFARHGRGKGEGLLLVPGVPEADSQREAGYALGKWLTWCAGSRSARRDGVTFTAMKED
ncbi:hypothetical protein [Achromobacter xylosoxidans]|uniref:hypothetical protein n=1 Tax=Alcaligenes xylosoxydans xylosoxydans TaxID=85698 RepID=UPI00203F6CC1|nr:hypothetical protein [Achromobacter xylosoxidans]MCM2572563.1 hypothetical protein [Achromobacter xylosoxidans]